MEKASKQKRLKAFMYDRFGMFIHFGLYSIPARGEWVRSVEKISNENYQQYFDEFNPVDYNPKEWAQYAKDAGMKYCVLTAKHHDGFCLFDSKLTEYKSTNTPIGRDLIKEYVEAMREVGIKIGLYYSIIDWHHEDYPKFGDVIHPMRENIKYKDEKINFDNYVEYLHGQVKELCTKYGKIDLLWFDFSYSDLQGEKWKATELIEMVRSLQPDVIIDNRLTCQGEIFLENPPVYAGDFFTPEQIIPSWPIVNQTGEEIPWESCITLNNNWGYCYYDFDFKSSETIIKNLVDCVSKGGNLLLNIGPDARGNIPKESKQILKEIAQWYKLNGESILGCGRSGLEKPEWGRYTRKGNIIYAHIHEQPIGAVYLPGIKKDDVVSIRRLYDNTELCIANSFVSNGHLDKLFVSLGPVHHFTYNIVNNCCNLIIKIILKDYDKNNISL